MWHYRLGGKSGWKAASEKDIGVLECVQRKAIELVKGPAQVLRGAAEGAGVL